MSVPGKICTITVENGNVSAQYACSRCGRKWHAGHACTDLAELHAEIERLRAHIEAEPARVAAAVESERRECETVCRAAALGYYEEAHAHVGVNRRRVEALTEGNAVTRCADAIHARGGR